MSQQNLPNSFWISLQTKVTRYLRPRIGASEDLENLVGMVIEACVKELQSQSPTSPMAYCMGIAGTKLADHHRAKYRRPEYQDLDDEAFSAGWLGRELLAASDVRTLETLLERLPERTRVALLLRADGLSYEVIGDIIGMSESAARARVFRAKQWLASQLDIRWREEL